MLVQASPSPRIRMGFGSGVLVGDHAGTPRECKTQAMHSSRWDFYCTPVRSGNRMVQQYSLSPELCSVGSSPKQKFRVPSFKSSFLVRLLFWLSVFILHQMMSLLKNRGLTDIKVFATLLLRLELFKLTWSRMVSGLYLSFQWSRKTKSRVSTSYFFFSWGIISSEGPSRSFT